MRLLLITGSYAPEVTAIGPLNADLVRFLVERGHEVDVVTQVPHYPQWRRYAGYRRWAPSREDVDGAHVIRVPSYIPRRPTPVRRIIYDSTFSGMALLGALSNRRRPDVIFAVCSPIQTGLTAAILRRRWKVPFVLHLQDLLPESAVELGMLRNGAAIAMADRLADLVYARADHITVIGEGFSDALVRRGVPIDKIQAFPNWVDGAWVSPGPRDNDFRRSLGFGSHQQLVVYVGNLGFKQGMETVIEAARRLQYAEHISVVIVGEGAAVDDVRAESARLGLANVTFLDVQPKERLPSMLAAGDLLLVHQRAAVREMVVPSKLLAYSSARRPILFAGNHQSAGAQFVFASGGGEVVIPEDPDVLAAKVLEMLDAPERLEKMASQGRAHVEQLYLRERVLSRAERFLSDVASRAVEDPDVCAAPT